MALQQINAKEPLSALCILMKLYVELKVKEFHYLMLFDHKSCSISYYSFIQICHQFGSIVIVKIDYKCYQIKNKFKAAITE